MDNLKLYGTLNNNTDMESAVVSFTYLLVTLDVDISSLLNKVLHCVKFVKESCQRQRSVLRENKYSHYHSK